MSGERGARDRASADRGILTIDWEELPEPLTRFGGTIGTIFFGTSLAKRLRWTRREPLQGASAMSRFETLLVGLSHSDQDDSTLAYAAMLQRRDGSGSLHCIHVMRPFHLPKELEHIVPGPEETQQALKQVLDKYFEAGPRPGVQLLVKHGAPAVELSRAARDLEVDLVIVGAKKHGRHVATNAEQVARNAPCSVLVVPEGSKPTITKILVPVDYSNHSVDALNLAVELSRTRQSKPQILALHVTEVPLGYHKAGKTYEEFADALRGHAQASHEELLASVKAPPDVPIQHLCELDDAPHRAICRVADRENADLMIIGSRGRTNAAATILGSVAERVIFESATPVIAVKQKGETLTFLQALLSRVGAKY